MTERERENVEGKKMDKGKAKLEPYSDETSVKDEEKSYGKNKSVISIQIYTSFNYFVKYNK